MSGDFGDAGIIKKYLFLHILKLMLATAELVNQNLFISKNLFQSFFSFLSLFRHSLKIAVYHLLFA